MTGPVGDGPVEVAGLVLRSPVVLAAGCAGPALAAYTDLAALGAVTTRSIALDPRLGAPAPRVVGTPSGLLHATGWPGPGLEVFLATELPELVRTGARVVVSVVGSTLGELAELGRRVGRAPGVSAVELDLTAPDPLGHGLLDTREPSAAARAVAAVAGELPPGVPALAKVRPDDGRLVETARAVAEAGARAVVVGSGVPAALPDGRAAQLVGAAVAASGRRAVALLHDALPALEVVGAGGVATAADVRTLLGLGARAVQVGSALLLDPTTPTRILEGLAAAADPAGSRKDTHG